MNALEKFKKLLETATPAARELVNALIEVRPGDFWDAIVINRDTPPAKEPVSYESQVRPLASQLVIWAECELKPGDRVRVTKIEES